MKLLGNKIERGTNKENILVLIRYQNSKWLKNTKIGKSPYKKTNMILPQGVIQSKKVQDNCEI